MLAGCALRMLIPPYGPHVWLSWKLPCSPPPPGSSQNDGLEPEKLITDATVLLYATQSPGLSEPLPSLSTRYPVVEIAGTQLPCD